MRLTGTTLTPLSCHWPLPEDAEQTSLGQGWREAGGVYPNGYITVIDVHTLLPADVPFYWGKGTAGLSLKLS